MLILGLVDISTTWILLAGVLLLIYIYGKRRNRFFKDVGIPGPEPIIYLGNMIQLIRQGIKFEDKNREKYGDVYGAFMGGIPAINVLDPDVIKEVLIKDFNIFTDRLVIELDDYPINKGMFFEKGEVWSRLRRLSSPTFSGAKLRLMCDRISKCAKLLTENFQKAADDKSDILIKEYFGAFTMDVIASTAFGMETNTQEGKNTDLTREAHKVFGEIRITNPFLFLSMIFPELVPLFKMFGVASFPKSSLRFFNTVVTEMIQQRREDTSKVKPVDFLQMLIEAEEEDKNDVTDETDKSSKESKKMTSDEILGQALLFFVAGFETTANTLHFASYLLATNPDVQDQLIDEIDSVLGDNDPDYDNIHDLTYLDHVITETLRMFPVVPAINRKASKTVTIKGYTFPKDSFISIPTFVIHRDPNIYSEPHRFLPDRWDRKSDMHPMNYLPFGHGPRHCLGMRLAQVEMKMGLAQVLKKIRFIPGDDTLPVLEGKDMDITGVFTTKKPIKLKVERR